eukprot:scaffold4423_cov105-Isochrysis_galbana.AAC.9
MPRGGASGGWAGLAPREGRASAAGLKDRCAGCGGGLARGQADTPVPGHRGSPLLPPREAAGSPARRTTVGPAGRWTSQMDEAKRVNIGQRDEALVRNRTDPRQREVGLHGGGATDMTVELVQIVPQELAHEEQVLLVVEEGDEPEHVHLVRRVMLVQEPEHLHLHQPHVEKVLVVAGDLEADQLSTLQVDALHRAREDALPQVVDDAVPSGHHPAHFDRIVDRLLQRAPHRRRDEGQLERLKRLPLRERTRRGHGRKTLGGIGVRVEDNTLRLASLHALKFGGVGLFELAHYTAPDIDQCGPTVALRCCGTTSPRRRVR